MTPTRWIWTILIGLYAAFFGWYTSFGGPLSEEEIAKYMAYVESADPPRSPERISQLRKFMEEDTGDDFVMVNVIDLYKTPLQIDGVEPGESSEDVLAKYMAYMIPALLARASHPVLYGSAASTAMDIMNADGMGKWTTGAGMRYRSRRDILDISTNPAFSGSHEFKIAAMSKTIAFPIDPWMQLGDPRLVLGLLLGWLGCGLSWREAARKAN
jgi:hypothetical protein